MRKILLFITLFYGVTPSLYSQDTDSGNGVVSFALPVRNSLKYNQFVINPAFSFVRQTGAYASFYNKRQWLQFDDAPQSYLFSYSGRFLENEGIGFGVFQQNNGLLTTFGALGNFAHNLVLQEDSNLTFGLNVAVYKSSLDQGKAIMNGSDPALNNIPSNTLLAINPGINYGNEFLDVGLAVNNLVLYNFGNSEMIKEDPEQSFQLHAMYTGYLDTYGFLDRSKFSALVRSEFKKEKTVISGVGMLTIPAGFWAQAGYNTLYGFSAGLGLNVSPKISIEYNYEKGTGNFSNFGASHEFVIAYKFKSKNYYYGDDDEEGALITPTPVRKPAATSNKAPLPRVTAEERAAQAKLTADAKAKADAEELQAKLAADLKAKADAEALQAKLAADAKAKADAEAQKAKLAADAKAKADAEALKAKLAADAKAKADAEAQKAKLAADAKAKADAEAQKVKLEAEAKAKADAEAQKAKLAADAKAKADAEALKQKIAADTKAKADAEALLAQMAIDENAKKEAEATALAKTKLEADAKAKADAEAQKVKLEAEAKAKADAEKAALLAVAAAKKEESKDQTVKSIDNLAETFDKTHKTQSDLINQLNATVASKQKELNEMREENDLSEKGIYKASKELVFKSISEENAKLETLKNQINDVNKSQKMALDNLTNLYNDRLKSVPNKNDALNKEYALKIEALKAEQIQAEKSNAALLASLEKIKVETEIERKRRIKRAAFENAQGKYQQDQLALKLIKETTKPSQIPLTVADFDFGEEQSNMQIIKNVKNEKSGYYLILAVHNDEAKRDEFLKKAVASGRSDINFFYNVNTSKYYIYYQKFDSIEEAQNELENKGNQPYNDKMSVVKLENE